MIVLIFGFYGVLILFFNYVGLVLMGLVVILLIVEISV